MSDSLIQALPDLVAFVRRDGVITACLGGRRLTDRPDPELLVGRNITETWLAPIAPRLTQMLRKALASRVNVTSTYMDGDRSYEARVSPQGRERVLCVIRDLTDAAQAAGTRATDAPSAAAAGGMERRGFMQRMKQSIADATLSGSPLALCVIRLGGLADIGRSIDFSIADRVATTALRRLPQCTSEPTAREPSWYIGQLGEDLLAVVVEGAKAREAMRATIQSICDSLLLPVEVGDACFQLAPCAGVAIHGEDASRPQSLLEHARAALAEARRSGAGSLQFYSDTIRMLPAMRMDLERELREAITGDQIQLRYVGRYDLKSGSLAAVQAYMRWTHPLRGAVAPEEFLPIAAATGLALALSRCALARCLADAAAVRAAAGAEVRLSFAPLRHHLVGGTLLKDLETHLSAQRLSPRSIEIRIAEKTIAAVDKAERIIAALNTLGVSVMIDEFGRGFSSLSNIAQLPVQALQIDRRYSLAAPQQPSAQRFCRGAIALAQAFGMTTVAPGIDDDATRRNMLALGCEQGLGDFYPPIQLVSPAIAAGDDGVAIAS
jgi:predicted signal transduction protein with EAL and GGDEF domain